MGTEVKEKSQELKKALEENRNLELASLSLYEMNQQIVSQLPAISAKEKAEGLKSIKKLFTNFDDNYFMLLSNELKYYTLFDFNQSKTSETVEYMINEICNCFRSLGVLKSIEMTRDKNAIEIWIDDNIFYLFRYDKGVIKYEKDKK